MPSQLQTMSRCRRCKCELAADRLSLDGTCPPCEVAYYESRDRLNTPAWFVLGFVLPWFAFAGIVATQDLPHHSGGVRAITTGIPMLDLTIMAVIVGVFSGKAMLAARRWFHRREFERARVAY